MTETMRLTSTKGKTVDSPFTDTEVYGILDDHAATLTSFGDKLRHVRTWSNDQRVWAHVIALEFVAPVVAKPAEPIQTGIQLAGILSLLSLAKNPKLKNPSITFELSGRTVELSLAGARAKRPGTINVTDGGPYGSNVWYGRINHSGAFEPSRSADAPIVEILTSFNADPAKYAAEYGRKTGRCCFCNLLLTDGRSTSVGYGPTCAKHYGMPWGVKDETAEPSVHDGTLEFEPVGGFL